MRHKSSNSLSIIKAKVVFCIRKHTAIGVLKNEDINKPILNVSTMFLAHRNGATIYWDPTLSYVKIHFGAE